MKKSLVTLVLGLVCSGAFSQTNTFPASGNVGIGTTTIDNAQQWNQVLQVHGTGHAKLLVTEGNGMKVGIFSHPNYNAKIGTESNHNLTLMAGYWNDVMTLTTTGNVGIGTTDPKGYKLAVAGNIIAESVKVKLQSAWPDFVFAPSYKIPTLLEIEKHIKEKGHLPGIPSANEVKANGVDLGDMNAKLLQKIEELTLHLIEMNKQNESFKEDLVKQQQEIKELKSKIK